MNLYFLSARTRFADARAVNQLLRECYGVIRAGCAPFCIGIIYQTVKPIPDDAQATLGVVPWH